MFLEKAENYMEKAFEHTKEHLNRFRLDKVDPDLINRLKVDYYGAPAPIEQVASISASDATTLVIKPFEKKMIVEIERAIGRCAQEMGLVTRSDSTFVFVSRNPLTQEERQRMVKHVKTDIEKGKVSIREIRHKFRDQIKQEQTEDELKVNEEKLQELTNRYIRTLDDLFHKKELELLKV